MWEQTVMGDEQIQKLVWEHTTRWEDEVFRRVAKAQAEISYKAGMKKVVEWINTHWWDRAFYPEWQAFLKEIET